MKKKFSAAAVIFTLLLSGCGSDGDLYAPREKNELLDPKETEPASAATDETETKTSDIDSILMQTHTETVGIETTALTETTVSTAQAPIGYWREQLSAADQQVYDAMYKALSECTKTAVVNRSVSADEVKRILNCLKEDHTELFWLGKTYNTLTGTEYTEITFDFISEVNSSNYTDYARALEAEADKIISQIPSGVDEYEKVLFVHDMIVNNTDYAADYTYKTYEESEMYYNAYGCLVNHYSVCDGYSKAFKLLMDKLGIRCGIVSGETIRSSGGHSWNYVLIDGDYYWIDVTWDDPVGQDPNEVKRELLHTYFCITDEQLLRNHILDSNLLFVPQCTSLTYNYMRKNGLLMDEYSFDGFNRIFSGITDHISVQFGNADTFYSAVDDLISGNAICSTDYMKENDKHSYSYSADEEQYVLSIYVK